jgi:cell division protein ZapE
MEPLQRYRQDFDRGEISEDEEQLRIVQLLDRLHGELVAVEVEMGGFWGRLRQVIPGRARREVTPKGLYLWGGVGRGKTYLMDLFYECLPLQAKRRTHFHRFMQEIHQQLTQLQGAANPLQEIAANIAADTRVLCFDEFFVSDIGDAMILAGLLDALFSRSVVLVATSNVEPRRLYENGLQRERFLPAIELLQKHTEVAEIRPGTDYRLQRLSNTELYLYPESESTEEKLLQSFRNLAPDVREIQEAPMIRILQRDIPACYSADDVVWFSFAALCDSPRSAFDYVEIARLYHALILSGVPCLNDDNNDQARRFINLIDELYDRRVKLILAADCPLEDLYSGSRLSFEFERTRSRLVEMQSHDYLGRVHRA